jgi:tRNA(Ile2) C34 agmatinyltransferase TiaS
MTQTGEELKQLGLALIEDHHADFVQTMRDIARQISQESGFVSSDNLRIVADRMGLVPATPNCWGAVFAGAKWKVVGRQKSAVPGNHGREIRVWRYEEE